MILFKYGTVEINDKARQLFQALTYLEPCLLRPVACSYKPATSAWSNIEREVDLLYWIDRLETWIANQAQTGNAKDRVEHIYGISWSVGDAS